MVEFIDKTPERSGTPINRKNLMGVQGFVSTNTTFNADGSITQINDVGQATTVVFGADGSVTETFSGEKTISKKTTFTSDGVKETIL
jgi:hypothetical protein